MLTAQLAKSMDDEHLLASARAEIDPLTSTALELELLERFERLLDEASEHKPVADLLEEYEVGTDDVKAVIESHPASLKDQAALLSLLNDQDIHEPDQLKELLELAAKFRALANDAGDFFTRLTDLVTTNQE
ncbi:MAG: hypothetical protein PHQ05_07690 [Sterolibacterium sp.]|nr:hypothetical protein [Sterolibacterium sp.]